MTAFQCDFCHQGPFDKSEVVRIVTKTSTFVLCGSMSCVGKLFRRHDPMRFPATGDICPSCESRPVVAAVHERGQPSIELCQSCLISMFFANR